MQTYASAVPVADYLSFLPLADTKEWLKVQHTAEDNIITNLIVSAVQYAEKYCSLDFIVKTRTAIVTDADLVTGRGLLQTARNVDLPYGPNQVIAGITKDYNGETTVVEDTEYRVYGSSYLSLGLNTIPCTGKYAIVYTSGFDTTEEATLMDLKTALLQIIASWYRHRENIEVGTIIAKVPNSASSILHKYIRQPLFT